jgi:hypothetical protein
MPARIIGSLLLIHLLAALSFGQAPATGKWRSPGGVGVAAKQPTPNAAETPAETADAARPLAAKVTAGPGVLPSDHGQLWREYDLTPYTSKITTTERPEQAVVDWILRETGTEIWFSQPLGVLNADRRTLRVYHTAEMHKVVAGVVDRFVAGAGAAQPLSLRLVSVGNPELAQQGAHALAPRGRAIAGRGSLGHHARERGRAAGRAEEAA